MMIETVRKTMKGTLFMKSIIRNLRYLPIVLPLVFTVLFFGYLTPRFDAIIYTDNIVGEGTCTTYLSSQDVSFAYLYKGDAYFGSELKTLRLTDLRFNVNEINLYVYGVESADILSFDISVYGHIVTHLSANGLSHPFYRDRVFEAITSTEAPLVHMSFEDPELGGSLNLSGFDFIPLWVWAVCFALILAVSVLLSLGFAFLADRFPAIRLPSLNAAAVMAALLLGAWFCGSFPYVNYTDFLLNWLILFAVSLALGALTLPWVGGVAVPAFTVFWYIANFFVISFRSKPVMPSDLRAIRTAMEVADGYDLRPNWQIAVSIVVVVLYIAAILLLYHKTKKDRKTTPLKKKLLGRGAALAAAVVMLVISVNNPAFERLNSFQWDAKVLEGFHREGIVLTFVNSAISAHVARPETYSRELVNSYLEEYEPQSVTGTQPKRIIMVMNEAFSDLRTVGLDPQIDVMPFIDSLDENTVEGRLYASVFGGGTCNTEFEALTGNSLAFLGTGAYPYTENVTAPLFSLASYFRDSGYDTEAFHANNARNWNRNIVYPHLGFDAFHSIKEYPTFTEETFLHNHPADIADYLYIEEVDKTLDAPRFLFNVTMQNHSDYDHFIDVEEDETVQQFGSDLAESGRVYLSLIKASDDAVRQLVETYRDSDVPTMIIFFGDHQPGLYGDAQANIYTTVAYYLDYFKTKFFIWTNYQTETVHDADISANFLPWLILERGNFPLPPYVQMLQEVHEKYPVISSQGVVDAEGTVYGSVAELMDDPLIQKYQNIQYANLFDQLEDEWFTTK